MTVVNYNSTSTNVREQRVSRLLAMQNKGTFALLGF